MLQPNNCPAQSEKSDSNVAGNSTEKADEEIQIYRPTDRLRTKIRIAQIRFTRLDCDLQWHDALFRLPVRQLSVFAPAWSRHSRIRRLWN